MNISVQFKMQRTPKILIIVDHEYTALNIATFIVKNKLEKIHYYILLDNCNYHKKKNIKDIFSFLKNKFYYYSKLNLEYKYFRILKLTSFYKIYKLNKKNKFKTLKFYNQKKLLQKNFEKIFFSRSKSSRIILNHFNCEKIFFFHAFSDIIHFRKTNIFLKIKRTIENIVSFYIFNLQIIPDHKILNINIFNFYKSKFRQIKFLDQKSYEFVLRNFLRKVKLKKIRKKIILINNVPPYKYGNQVLNNYVNYYLKKISKYLKKEIDNKKYIIIYKTKIEFRSKKNILYKSLLKNLPNYKIINENKLTKRYIPIEIFSYFYRPKKIIAPTSTSNYLIKVFDPTVEIILDDSKKFFDNVNKKELYKQIDNNTQLVLKQLKNIHKKIL